MATRELTIVYGSLTVSSGTYQVHGVHRMGEDFERGFVEFECLVTAADSAALVTACEAIEAAYRTPYSDLTVSYDGEDILTVAHSTNDGFEASPSIEKIGNERDTARSRLYRCRVDYQRPADTVSDLGLRRKTVEVAYSPSRRRTVTIRGEYTARSSNGARAEYEARIAALQSSVLSALSISTSEVVSEVAGPETTNGKTMTFERVIREIVFGQGDDGDVDDSGLVEQSLVISRRDEHPGDTGTTTKRLQALDATYSAAIDKDVSTDPAAKWESIRDWVIGRIGSFAEGQVALTSERVSVDYDENRLTVQLSVLARLGADKIEHRLTVVDFYQYGTRIIPVWEGGDVFASSVFQGPARYVRSIRMRTRYGSSIGISGAMSRAREEASEFESNPPGIERGEWDHVSDRVEPTQLAIGTGNNRIEVTDIDAEVVLEWTSPVAPRVVTP